MIKDISVSVQAVLHTALKRLRASRALALCALAALVTGVALSVSVPVYAGAASLRVLSSTLARQEQQTGRPAFALLFRYYVSGTNPALEWDRVQPADTYLRGPALDQLHLPVQSLGRHARSGELQLRASSQSGGGFLKQVTLGFVSGLDDQMRIVDGAPARAAATITRPIEVLMLRDLASEVGINVGDTLLLVAPTGVTLPIQVSGLWEAVNGADAAWFYPPDALQDVILVPEASWSGPISAALHGEVNQMLWFARLDGSKLTTAQADPLASRIERVRAHVASMVGGLALEQSPADALSQYRGAAAELTAQVGILSVPILLLVLDFMALVAMLLVERQRAEIALLKSRGVGNAAILGMYLVEWSILAALALALGAPLGLVFAAWMGQTQSFLRFATDLPPLIPTLSWDSLRYGVGAVVFGVITALIPAVAATRGTLVDEQQRIGRPPRSPLWQRVYLDLLLIVPAGYGLYQLQRGAAGPLGTANPFDNPLLALVPFLLCFALGLVALRVVPVILDGLMRLAARSAWTIPLVAMRTLARQPAAYRNTLLLLILTLSIAAFSASMAATLDASLEAAIAYQVGAATQLLETGQSTDQPAPDQAASAATDIREEARWQFVPVAEHLAVPGITAATRVGSYQATLRQGGPGQAAQLVGIDRTDFPAVVQHFDPTWGNGQSLGALMNLLAQQPQAILVSADVLNRGFQVNGPLPAVVEIAGDRREITFTIAGAIDLWPGYYPDATAGPILVANLQYIFDQMGGHYPYDVWIARAPAQGPDPQTALDALVRDVRAHGITLVDVRDAETMIRQAQLDPQRQGLFGLLSVGFLAAATLTLLGLLLTALLTVRRRGIELGVLQALGLPETHVRLALIIEQGVLAAMGLGIGTAIGLGVAVLVVPRMQGGAGPHPGVPSVPARIAWQQIQTMSVVVGLTLALTLGVLAWLLRRMRLFETVKLGDAN